jgi:hypothetical protein
VLAVAAARVAVGSGSLKEPKASLTARLLAQPPGRVLFAVLGLTIVAGAAYVVFSGLKCRFLEDLDCSGADPRAWTVAIRLGQIGHAALGVAYGLVGTLVIVAAARFDPAKAEGLDVALRTFAETPYGGLLLLAVAAGVACYGVYCIADARYRRSH